MKDAIFLIGITERSGTNYLQDLLKQHPDCYTPAPIHEDYLLFGADHLVEYVETVFQRWDPKWGDGLGEPEKTGLLKHIGGGLLGFLSANNKDNKPRLLTKTPNVTNLHLFFDLFPESRLILLVRDGRAVVESTVKSFGLSYDEAILKWTRAAETIKNFMETHPQLKHRYRLFRYEDVYSRTEEVLADLLEFLDLEIERYPFEKASDLPVRGSSVFRGDTTELHWKPVKKTEEFNPLQRFQHWTDEQHELFNRHGGKLLEFFGYQPKAPASYAFSYQMTFDATGRPAKPEPSRPTLYCRTKGALFPLDQQNFLFVNQRTQDKIIVGRDSALIHGAIDRFDTLENHIDNSPFLEQLGRTAIEEHLQEQIDAGLLITDADYLHPLLDRSTTREDQTSTRAPIVIRTCERPEYIERILDSLAKRDQPDREPIVILEDSRNQHAQEANMATVQKYRDSGQLDVKLVGLKEQEDFLLRLCSIFPQHETSIRWLVAPRREEVFTGGRIFNLIQLLFAGEKIIVYDDDYLLDSAKELEHNQQEMVSLGAGKAYDLIGYTTPEEMLEEGVLHDSDPIREHLQLLGKPLGAFLAAKTNGAVGNISLAGLGYDEMTQYQSHSRILTTGNGQYGQPIEPSATWLYTFPDYYRPKPWESTRSYNGLREGEYYWKTSHDVRVTRYTLETPVGLDNTTVTPPTIPVGRGEDTLFTVLLQLTYPDAVHVELPWAIAHLRQRRNWKIQSTLDPLAPSFAYFMLTFAQQHEQSLHTISDPTECMNLLGNLFIGWANRTNDEIREIILDMWSEMLAYRISKLEQQSRNRNINNPKYLEDLQNLRKATMAQIANLKSLPPFGEMYCPAGEREQIQWAREELERYGTALKIWPELWNYCRKENLSSGHAGKNLRT